MLNQFLFLGSSSSSTAPYCNKSIITYDFCLDYFGYCSSGTTSPSGVYNGKFYYVVVNTSVGYLWWNLLQNKWEFSTTLGTSDLNIYLNYGGNYPYDSAYIWSGVTGGTQYFKTCDCTCTTKPNYLNPNYIQVNECSVLTIHPMGVTCIPTQPSTPGGYGSLSILITGGTPPYTVTLLNSSGNAIRNIPPINSNQTNIPNILAGTYFIEITDQFGDFQLLINCTIPETTTTTTTTIVPLPSTPSYQEYSFCLAVYLEGRAGAVYLVSMFFVLEGFTYSNNLLTPTWATSSNDEIIYWNTTTNNWTLSATSSSDLVTYLGNYNTSSGWQIVNTSSVTTIPLNGGAWQLISNPTTLIPTIIQQFSACKNPELVFWINESWWQYYGSNIPNLYRGSACGGGNETPWFKWTIYNLPSGISVTNYEIICTHISTGDVYFDVTGITQTQVSNNIPWNGSQTINPTTGGGTANSQGWEGPCLPALSSPNFEVTLTANLSSGSPLVTTINFIYCQGIINGICAI